MATRKDGHATRITLVTSAITFEEKSVTPPAVDGGDGIDQTHNGKTTYREKAARSLKEVIAGPATVKYDPALTSSYNDAVNLHQLIQVAFADNDSVAFYGYLKSFTPSEMAEGEEPTMALEFEACGVDAEGAEQGVVYSSTTT